MNATTKSYANEILKDIKKKKIQLYERDKNIIFVKKYNLTTKDIESIIYSLTANHFKGRIENKDKRINSKYLYYFIVLIPLQDEYGSVIEKVYIKICEISKGILVVSLHENEE